MLDEIILKDGSTVKIDTKLNIKKLMLIDRDFDTSGVVTLAFDQKGRQDFNVLNAVKAVYVAYRQANMNDYISFEAFTEAWDLDTEFALHVYAELVIGGKRQENRNSFNKSFKSKK